MIIIDVRTPWAKVDCSEKIKRRLYKTLAVPVKYAHAVPRLRDLIRSKKWDGKIHFFRRLGTMPLGFVDLIQDTHPEHVEVKGEYQFPSRLLRKALKKLKTLKLEGIKELGDFQILAVKRMFQHQRGIVKVATNGGKTEIASAFIKLLLKVQPKAKVLYVVHLKTLLNQTAKRVQLRTGLKVGKIGAGFKDLRQVTVGMVQSLPKTVKANRDFYNQFDVLILDEAQHTSANTWYNIALQMRAPWRFALSGTPWTGDDARDARLVGVVGNKILANVRNQELIKRGWSARPTVHVHELRHYAENGFSWRMAYDTMIVNDSIYNEKIVDLVKESWEAGKSTMVFVNFKRHGIRLYRRMLGEKIDVKYLCGDTPDETIQKSLQRFEQGKLGVIVCTPIFDEGLDVPVIRTLVMAAAGKAPNRLLQRIGRGLRKKKTGKNVTDIHDFIHYGNAHLERWSLERMETILNEDFDVRFYKAQESFASKRYYKTGELDWDKFHREGLK